MHTNEPVVLSHPVTEAKTRTHRVAVGAYIIHNGEILLLKRAHPPLTFAPPGGKLEMDEDPVDGVKREVLEETGMHVEVLGVAHTWFGSISPGRAPLLCINYIAETIDRKVVLSAEHTDFIWVSCEDLRAGLIQTRDEYGNGYKCEHILMAFELYKGLRS